MLITCAHNFILNEAGQLIEADEAWFYFQMETGVFNGLPMKISQFFVHPKYTEKKENATYYSGYDIAIAFLDKPCSPDFHTLSEYISRTYEDFYKSNLFEILESITNSNGKVYPKIDPESLCKPESDLPITVIGYPGEEDKNGKPYFMSGLGR